MDIKISISAIPEAAKFVRKRLRQVLTEDWGLPFNIPLEDLIMAVGEGVSNAYRHGCSSPLDTIKIRISCDADKQLVTVEISDPGKGFDISKPLRIERIQGKDYFASGRFIMSKCCDSVSYEHRDNCFVCILKKCLC